MRILILTGTGLKFCFTNCRVNFDIDAGVNAGMDVGVNDYSPLHPYRNNAIAINHDDGDLHDHARHDGGDALFYAVYHVLCG